jgi:hypothetical protein
MEDSFFVNEVARDIVGRFGVIASAWVRQQISEAGERGDRFSTEIWSDIAKAVGALLSQSDEEGQPPERRGA